LVAPPCPAASAVRSRPRSISFETFSEPTSGSNDFSAYQHIDLSPDSLKSLKDSPQRRSCSAACATGTDLIFLARTNWVTLYLKTLGKANAKEEWSLLGEKELLYGVFEDADQFFETINPLNGFEGKESLETYMWEQSLKVEPKDAEKLDNVKPSRPPNVLKSPGIKPPKTLSSVVSSSGPSNHYAGYRSSGRGFSTAFNTYSPGMFNEPPDTPRCFAENASQMEEKNSHLGMVEINPGYQPRYLGDARRGEVSPLTPLPNLATPPPLIPRLRKEKARSGPPSPLSNIISSCSKSNEPSHSPPPPLYPRRTSPHFFPSPIPPPPPFRAPSVTSCTAPTSPLSPPSSSAPTGDAKRAESFVFPPNSSMDENRTLLTEAGASHAGCSNAPAVPPRRKGDALPAPLPLDAVRVVWSGEASPGTPLVTAVLPLPPSFDNDAPPLYPRRLVNVEPPPRPPKKNKQRCLASASTNTAYMESSGSESPPPPLPPKTYKRQQRRS
uniref:SH2 domain-containing protein n=1 Tax=Toxocara canis TaxID=6265 RepID=A0A183UYF2_TOXCA